MDIKIRILIVGQENSPFYPLSRPFEKGNSSKRLWRWFGVTDFKSLIKIADTFNIRNIKNTTLREKMIKKYYHIIFLIGKIAKKEYISNKRIIDNIEYGKIITNIPHPSELNVSCNYQDKKISRKVQSIIAKTRRRYEKNRE